MTYQINGTELIGGDSPEDPSDPRTFPITYNNLIGSLQSVLSDVEVDIKVAAHIADNLGSEWGRTDHIYNFGLGGDNFEENNWTTASRDSTWSQSDDHIKLIVDHVNGEGTSVMEIMTEIAYQMSDFSTVGNARVPWVFQFSTPNRSSSIVLELLENKDDVSAAHTIDLLSFFSFGHKSNIVIADRLMPHGLYYIRIKVSIGNSVDTGEHEFRLYSLVKNTHPVPPHYHVDYSNATYGDATRALGGGVAIGIDSHASNTDGVAVGHDANAIGTPGQLSVAVGAETQARHGNIAIGYAAKGLGDWGQNLALGYGAETNASWSAIAIGNGAQADGDNSIAIGQGVVTSNEHEAILGNIENEWSIPGSLEVANFVNDSGRVLGGIANASDFSPSIAVGVNSLADKLGVAVGEDSEATNWTSVAVGYNASTTGDSGVSIGGSAKALAGNAVAVGQNSNATAGNTVAIGSNIHATHVRSVAIGHGAVTAAAGEGVLGGSNTFNHVHAWRIPGSLKVEGDFTAESGIILKAPNDSLWRVTVDNSGNLQTAAA